MVAGEFPVSASHVMINTLQKPNYSHSRIMFILCFMPKRSIYSHRYQSVWPLKTF